MSIHRTLQFALSATLTLCILGPASAPAWALTPVARTASSAASLQSALKRLDASRAKSERLDSQVAVTSSKLDRLIDDEERINDRLTSRASVMYRTGDTTFVTVLLGAATYQEFASRWELLTRMSEQDAEDLRALVIARNRAEESAESLIALQERQARAVDALAREVAGARAQLAKDRTALEAYRARAAAAPKPASTSQPKPTAKPDAKRKSEPVELREGKGAWKSGVASHYSRTFTGRGASGDRIGPYSMMVAHKSLPFGTLVEFEYDGKRAVAKVADRGPYTKGRDFDLGPGVVRVLGFSGVHTVRYRIVKD